MRRSSVSLPMMCVVLATTVVLSGCTIATETGSSPSAAASVAVVPSPSASASSDPEAPLGGGLILATAFVPKDDTVDVFTRTPGAASKPSSGRCLGPASPRFPGTTTPFSGGRTASTS